ncbi:OmpA family protein [Actinomadura sp. CNU-125]|uniref:OmpA family protein n=1 Tax=Actinomadura sp. CNU-125 TaxID=1904961 RepID=UPI0013013A84|nr:OmpA family protein [Actinomadura sp. CNU-125]
MKDVQHFPDHSVLRFYLSNPGKESTFFSFGTSVAGSAFGALNFGLVDPVGHKAYTPLYTGSSTVGSDLRFQSADPGARYETVLAFPPLPASVDTVTVVTPTTAGEFTSVPVVDGTSEPPFAPEIPKGLSSDKPGTTLSWPTRQRTKEAAGGTYDLYGLTESPTKSTTTSSTEEKVGLRTDVLFAFDKATLSARAETVLDEVARETRAKADPAKPPIVITGHTDGKGDDAYNMDLSRRRADAVRAALQARLGTGYRYRATARARPSRSPRRAAPTTSGPAAATGASRSPTRSSSGRPRPRPRRPGRPATNGRAARGRPRRSVRTTARRWRAAPRRSAPATSGGST